MASNPLEAYFKSLKRNEALTDVSRPASMGGGMVYDKKAEKSKIQQRYLDSLPAQSRFKGMPVNDAQQDRRARTQNQQMDQKVLQEANLRNQFDQARGLGGDIGREAIRDIAMDNPGGVETFNKMNKGKITFSELTGGLGNTVQPPQMDPNQMAQANYLVDKLGYTPDDMRSNPALKRMMDNNATMETRAEANVDSMLASEDIQRQEQEHTKEMIEQDELRRWDERAVARQELYASAPNSYYGPNMKREDILKQANNAVKYGEKDNIMQMVQGVMGGDNIGKTQGLMGMLNMRAVMQTAGADDKMLSEFDELGHNARIDKMDRNYKRDFGDKPLDASQLAEKRGNKYNKEFADSMLAERSGPDIPDAKKSPLKSAMLKSQLFAGRFGKGLTDDSYKQYVQEGGYMRPDGKQGYFLGGLAATALGGAAIGAGKKALMNRAMTGVAEGGDRGGFLSNIGKGLSDTKKRYLDDPVSAGKLESIMASTDSEGNPINEEEARKVRDAGGGSADFATTLGRGLSEFGGDTVEGLKTGATGVAGAVAGGALGIGKGLKAGYTGLTKDKASYEDFASGKEKGSLLQRIGKGMSFAGNVVDKFNEDMPFSSMGQSDVNFTSSKDGKKEGVKSDDGYINKTDEVEGDPLVQDQVSKDIKKGEVKERGIEMEGVDGKVIPAAILDKVKDMDSLKGLKPEQLMTIQKALGGISVDGKFGPETMGAMQKYFDNANRPPIEESGPEPAPVRSQEEIKQSYPAGVNPANPYQILKQQGGFITKLMKQGRAY